jgi:CRP/FNR family cyclic AMP-dependent transcriptional regulator
MDTSSNEATEQATPAARMPGTGSAADDHASNWRPNSYLGMLAPATLKALLSRGVREVFRPGRTLIAEGNNDTDMFVLLEGIAKVTATGASGEEFIDFQAKGDTVGELAAINPSPKPLRRSATVKAAGEVTAIRITKPDLDAFFIAYPDAAVTMAFMLGGRQMQKMRQLLDISGFDAPERVARTLAAAEEKLGVPTADGTLLNITQTELANLAVLGLPTVQQVLRDLRNKHKAIQTGYRTITITDMAALRLAGEPGDRQIP